MEDNQPKTLYICYFGLREPLVQTQVLPYLKEIHKDGIRISILTFEPEPSKYWSSKDLEDEKQRLKDSGIDWHYLTYHKRPSLPATVFDIFAGSWYVWNLNRKEQFDLFHGRVHLPTFIGLIARKLSWHKPKLLFDVRGFFPEEYTDAGVWKENGLIFKVAKFIENWLRRESDGFIVLTEKAREIWFPESKETGVDTRGRPVEVIPCCVDLKRFESANNSSRKQMREELNIENRNVIVYLGSFGGFYMTQETADFFGAAKKRDPNSFALILTQSKPEMIKPLLEIYGYSEKDFFIQSVSPGEVPKYLSAADLAVSFIKPCYSKLSSSPTKNAEYLACGLPIVVNSGVGDVTELIEENGIGTVLTEFKEKDYLNAFDNIATLIESSSLEDNCRKTAQNEFGLESVGGEKYRKIYQKLLR